MGSLWSALKDLPDLLGKFFVLYPPFPEQAAFSFLSLKGVAYLTGIVCAIVIYARTQIKQYRAMLASWWFLLDLFLLACAVIGYQQLFQIDSPSDRVKLIEYILYFFINWNIALLVFLIIFLIPYDKLKSFMSLFKKQDNGKSGTGQH